MDDSTHIPVTLLTGFLGAGKTTLLNYLLENSPHQKIAIIENEFAAENIDAILLKRQATTEVIELANGCVCCTIKGELHDALLKIHTDTQTALAQGLPAFSRIIIETTGLADPSPIIQTFFVDEVLREYFILDAVITLVDAQHTLNHLSEHPVCASQIGFADRLVITKTDCISAADLDLLCQQLQNINAKAPILIAAHGRLEPAQWLDLHAFNLNDESPISRLVLPPISHQANPPVFSLQNRRSYQSDVVSHILKCQQALDLDKIGTWMETLIETHGHDLLRYKGLLFIHDEPRILIVQGIHKVAGFDYGVAWQNTPESILILIGRNLPIDTIREQFLTCCAE